MADHDWSTGMGLRNAALSLTWRALVVAVIWVGSLWGFHAVLDGIGAERVPTLIAAAFSLLEGTIAGVILSRELETVAGFVSPILTLMAGAFAVAAIVGGESLFAGFLPVATDHLRFLITGIALIVALVWIVKNTLLE